MRPDGFDTPESQSDSAVCAESDCSEQCVESRALVALSPLPGSAERMLSYRYAPFLAQLVATKDQHPQTRERRRAEPDVAVAAYRAAAALAV
jgi:hypothetical protein